MVRNLQRCSVHLEGSIPNSHIQGTVFQLGRCKDVIGRRYQRNLSAKVDSKLKQSKDLKQWLLVGGQKLLAENLCTTGQGIPPDFCGIPEICKKKHGPRCRMPHGKYGKFMKTMELLPIFTGVITLTSFHPKRSTSGVRRVGLVVPLQVSPTSSITVSKASNSWPSSKAWVLGENYQHFWMKLVLYAVCIHRSQKNLIKW